MAHPRVASLFSGTGALDLAVQDVFGGHLIWHSQYEPPDKNGKEDTHQYAARILARHWPGVPNLGDITRICWACILAEHGPVDILTGGFPCTDVSSAGQRAGLLEGTRSGLWNHMARAIAVLQPRLVVIENVEGLLSAPADRGLEPDAEAVAEGPAEGPGRRPAPRGQLRALGAVLGDLATLGFDAEWLCIAASETGAAHRRKRVIILAWPAAAHAQDLGHEWPGPARRRRPGSPDGDLPASHTHRRGLPGHRELPAGRDALQQRIRDDAHRRHPAPADTEGERRGEGRPEPAGILRRPDAAQRGGASPADAESSQRRIDDGDDVRAGSGADGCEPTAGRGAPADADSLRWRADILNLRPGQPDLDWGDYGPAIRRWEPILGRPAPWPTDALGRLTPVFPEWMMGLPDGWVTCTPGPDGMSPAALRNAMLKALGNGVVRQQAAAALRLLRARAAA